MIEFDEKKDTANRAKHGIPLSRAVDLDIRATVLDPHVEERRFRSFGLIDRRPHCLIFTLRNGVVRAISLRRVHKKEYERYVPPQSRL